MNNLFGKTIIIGILSMLALPCSGKAAMDTVVLENNNYIAMTTEDAISEGELEPVIDISAPESIIINAKGICNTEKIHITCTAEFMIKTDCSWLKMAKSDNSSKASNTLDFKQDGDLYLFAEINRATEDRIGQIYVNSGDTVKTITVEQEGMIPILKVDVCDKIVDQSGMFFNNEIFIETKETGTVMIEADQPWIGLSLKNTTDTSCCLRSIFFEGGSVYLAAEQNQGEKREATVTITHSLGIKETFKVVQEGIEAGSFDVDREIAYFDDPGEAVSEAVTVAADDSTKWSVTTNVGWIRLMTEKEGEKYASLEGKGKGIFYIYVKKNNRLQSRSGCVTIFSGEKKHSVSIWQAENEISKETLLEETDVSVTRKRFNKGKTSKIKISFHDGLYFSDVSSISYSSNKEKVAVVNNAGIIKGIRKGTAVISVRITLGEISKTFKQKITIGKRKIE